MARITVEDCLENVENRFELVMVGSKRARQLAVEGRAALLDEENDKPTVLALREIAEGLIDASILSVVEQEFTIDEIEEDPIPKENSDVSEPLSLGHTDASSQPNVDALPVEPILSGLGLSLIHI